MSYEAIVLNPMFLKYVDLSIMAAIHACFSRASEMTEEELDAEIARLEPMAGDIDAWIEERLLAAARSREESP